jgi:hypothetical protein
LTGNEALAATRQNSFTYEELIECAKGNLFGPGNAQLPLPPMLMVDVITSITEDGGPPARVRSWPSSKSRRIDGSSSVTSRAIP